jgi:hypothetical protein
VQRDDNDLFFTELPMSHRHSEGKLCSPGSRRNPLTVPAPLAASDHLCRSLLLTVYPCIAAGRQRLSV